MRVVATLSYNSKRSNCSEAITSHVWPWGGTEWVPESHHCTIWREMAVLQAYTKAVLSSLSSQDDGLCCEQWEVTRQENKKADDRCVRDSTGLRNETKLCRKEEFKMFKSVPQSCPASVEPNAVGNITWFRYRKVNQTFIPEQIKLI